MNWVAVAITGTVILSIVNIVDSHLLSKRFTSFQPYLLLAGILHFIFSFTAIAMFPFPAQASPLAIALAMLSGLLRSAAVLIMLDNLRRDEVSRVIPVIYAYPIFVAALAVPVLGERLAIIQWAAIVIVVAGTLMVSARDFSALRKWPGRFFLLLTFASLCFGGADVAAKYALTSLSAWNLFSMNALLIAASFTIFSLRPRYLKELAAMPNKAPVLGAVIVNETLAPLGIGLYFWAMQFGPVSLVSTIFGSRPVFVMLFAYMISRIMPRFLHVPPGGKMLALRVTATGMIVAGIAIITLA